MYDRLPPHLRRVSLLRWRLSAAMSGLLLLCIAVCIAGSVQFLNQALTDQSTSELSHAVSGVSSYLGDQRSDLIGMARLVADAPGIHGDVVSGNRQALILRLTPLYADLNAEVMDVVDRHGKVLVRMENTLHAGDVVANRPDIAAALQGHQVAATEQDLSDQIANGYALTATVPIEANGKIVGAVVVGRQLDSIFADRLGRALNVGINLIAGNQRLGSNLTDRFGLPSTGLQVPAPVLDRIARGEGGIQNLKDNGHDELYALVPLKGTDGHWVGAVQVVRPLDSVHEVIRVLSFLLLVLGAVIVVVGILLILSISRRLTGRLNSLEKWASDISARLGRNAPLGDSGAIAELNGLDEVASLARSFRAMTQALDERMSANAALFDAAQARVRELSGLAEIARLITAQSSLTETTDAIGARVCHLVGARSVAIWLPGTGSAPALFGGHGLPPNYEELNAQVLSEVCDDDEGFETAAQQVIREGRVIFRDVKGERSDTMPAARRQLSDALQATGCNAATAVPLRVGDKIVGALTCYTSSTVPLAPSDLNLLTTVSDQVAVAVENARLAQEAQARAALEERLQAQEQVRQKQAQYRAIFDATLDGLVINDIESGLVVEANPAYCRMHGYEPGEMDGMHPNQIVHASHQNDVFDMFEHIAEGASIQAQGVNRRKDGSIFPVEVYGTLFTYNGKPHVLAVVRDITERVHAYELLEKRVEERTRELSTLLNVSSNVASMLELRPLLRVILQQLKQLLDFSGAAILMVEDDELEIAEYSGPMRRELVLGSTFPIPDRTFWDPTNGSGALIISDTQSEDDEAAVRFRAIMPALGEMASRAGRSILCVPLKLKDDFLGMLALHHVDPNHYLPHHASLAMAIANQAAVAIENARLYESAQEMAALQERQRLARELHDSVSQALFGIALGARTAQSLLPSQPDRASEPLDYVLSLAQAGLSEMRALIFELRPEALETEGLVAVLEKQVEAIRARHGIEVEACIEQEPNVPLPVKEALYRIVQEALHNVVKHARAKSIRVRMEIVGAMVKLEVVDDGRGFDITAAFPGHLGLQTMRERATRLGAELRIESSPEHGTRISLDVPVHRSLYSGTPQPLVS